MPIFCLSARRRVLTKTAKAGRLSVLPASCSNSSSPASASPENRSTSPTSSSAARRRTAIPLPDEIEACRPYLDRQIELIQPKLVITLGRFSMARSFPGQSITRIHGQIKREGDLSIVPMFHPAAALRNPQWMEEMKKDFAQLAPLVAELAKQRAEHAEALQDPTGPPVDDYQQLSMF